VGGGKLDTLGVGSPNKRCLHKTLDVVINYKVAQNKRTPGSSFKFVIQQRFEASQNNDRNVPEISIKRSCDLQNLHRRLELEDK